MSWRIGFLAFARDERVTLLGIGIATFGIVTTMIKILSSIRDENEIPPIEPKTQYITQDTEDALQPDTLDTLIDHPNYSIRDVAIKILCDRAINDPETLHALLYGITRPDYEERMRCLRALALLTGQTLGLDGLSKLNNLKAYSALVRSLQLSLDDVDRPSLNDEHWDEYYLRDMAERFCLMFILELINKYGVDLLIKAKFVERWLVKQEWGNTPEERRQNFTNYTDTKNNRIVDVIKRLKTSRRGISALIKAGLLSESFGRRDRMNDRMLLFLSGNGPAPQDQGIEGQTPRVQEISAEEQRLRRQHREAMVLNDGSRPLGRDDIIERDHSPPPS